MMNQVDVIVPCYNYGHYLAECVESILSQIGVEVRVLIIDDASTDSTPIVGARLAAQDARVEFRRHATNQGHIATFNEGIEWTSGSYLLLLSADDVLVPGALHRAAEWMDLHPEIGMTYGRAIHTRDPASHTLAEVQGLERTVLTGTEFLEQSCEVATNIVPTPTAVVRTSLQKALGGYRRDLPHTGDMEMWLRISAHASIGVIDAVQAYYRLHDHNMSLQYADLADVKAKWEAFDLVFRQFAHRITRAEELRRLALRNLCQDLFAVAYRLSKANEPGRASSALAMARELDPGRWRYAWFCYRRKQQLGPKVVTTLSPVVRLVHAAFSHMKPRSLRATAAAWRRSRKPRNVPSSSQAKNDNSKDKADDSDRPEADAASRTGSEGSSTGPLVSVVICTYNYARYIARAIQSVQAQSYSNWECIVVDDASTDDTAEIVAELAARDSRIRYQRNPRNLGVGASRNLGDAVASGEWIAVLDADDWWRPDKLEAQIKAVQAHPAAALCYTSQVQVTGTQEAVVGCPEAWWSDLERMLRVRNFIVHSSVMVARKSVMDVGGYEEHLLSAHDWDLYLKVLRRQGPGAFVYVDQPLVYYRMHDNSVRSNWRRMMSDERQIITQTLTQKGWVLLHPQAALQVLDEQVDREIQACESAGEWRMAVLRACVLVGLSPLRRWRWQALARNLSAHAGAHALRP